jgi:hypothetical protein
MHKGYRAESEPIYFTPRPVRGRYLQGLWGGGKAPAAPDPVATAQAQGQANIDAAKATAEFSRTNEVSPFGTTTWGKSADGRDQSTFALDPKLQGMLDNVYKTANSPGMQIDLSKMPTVGTGADYRNAQSTQGADTVGNMGQLMTGQISSSNDVSLRAGDLAASQMDRLKSVYGQEFNYDKLGAMPSGSDATRKAVEDAYYSKAKSRLDPQWQQQEAEMRSRLANQGLTEGSEAYNAELQQMMRGRTDAYGQATNDAILNSTTEMGKQFAMQLAARQQGVSEQNYVRELATKEAQAAMGLSGEASSINNNNAQTQANLFQAQSALKDAAGNRAVQNQSMDNITRDKALNEQLTQKNLEGQDRTNLLNTLMALRTGSQVNAPGTGQIQVAAAPVAQSIYNSYQGQVDSYNASQASKNGLMGGLGGIGAAFAGSGAGSAMLASF